MGCVHVQALQVGLQQLARTGQLLLPPAVSTVRGPIMDPVQPDATNPTAVYG